MVPGGRNRNEGFSFLGAEAAGHHMSWYEEVGFPGGASDKELTCPCSKCERCRFDPWVRKIPCKRKWQPTWYSCLENPMDRGARRATVHGVAKSQTCLKRLSAQMKKRQECFN